jgi:hypothetical protein
MFRGRHAKRSGLLARLFPRRAAKLEAERTQRALLRQVAEELRALRQQADEQAAAAVAAEHRARAAEVRAAAAEERAEAAGVALLTLRSEVARLREEMLWAWAEGRLPAASLTDGLVPRPATVVDLREAAGS